MEASKNSRVVTSGSETSSGNSALKFAAKEGGTAMEDTMDGLEGIEATGQPNSGTTVVQVSF